ncbi:MAG: amp-binding enzyme, partial [Verrucomicrobiaceae bacterium]|nr:amp-binding enzyme [Verrucomicrobiaceae bacterium]
MSKESPVHLKDITFLGQQNLPSAGFMIVPSSMGYNDLLGLEAVLGERGRIYIMEDEGGLDPQLKAHLENGHVTMLVIQPQTTDVVAYRAAMKEAADVGSVVIYLPADAATLTAPLTTVPGAKLEFLLKAEIPVVPVYVHHRKATALAIEGSISPTETTMAFDAPLEGAELTLAGYQESLMRLAEQCFARNPALDISLGYALLQGLKKHGTTNSVFDGKDGGELRFDKILAAAIVLGLHIRTQTKKQRVGIILPPSPIGLIANIAVLLIGKTPVNLNFTAGRDSISSAMKQADMDCFLTADTFVRKMQSFPWPPLKELTMLERLMPTLQNKIKLWYVLSKALPVPLLAMALGLSRKGGNREATLLFTSGSSGEPKGVVLSHRNLIANVSQFGSRLSLKNTDTIMACLPLFHSFGCTVTLWYPVIQGLNVVTYPTPMETKKLAELVQKHKVSLMITTPTFLRGYLKGVNREQLASLKLVVTGAEKLPRSVADAFEARFGKTVMEGYGLTETSPASNVNLPDPAPVGAEHSHPVLPGGRAGSVGQLLPGLAVRITHPDTGERLPVHQTGIIWFKGANVFTGYLNDPKRTADVLDKQGWFRSGDVGRMDMDGFLYIEGRLSRFSKIAGEMVPHETVEEAVIKAMGLENESTRKIVITGVPDAEKG